MQSEGSSGRARRFRESATPFEPSSTLGSTESRGAGGMVSAATGTISWLGVVGAREVVAAVLGGSTAKT